MQFQVPQFIEVENKIVGPLSLKQFIFIAGGVGASIALFLLIPWWYVAIIPIALVMGISLTLALYKYNNRSVTILLESAVKYFFGSKLYVWRKEEKIDPNTFAKEFGDLKVDAAAFVPKLGDSKLKDLVWTMDTNTSANPVTRSTGETNTQ